jgi:cell division protein FtsZ
MGVALMGTGVGEGATRALDAANRAISSPLLEDTSIQGARGVIINVTGGPDLSLMEVSEASSIIHKAAHEEANIIFGAVVDPQLQGRVKITVIATGFGAEPAARVAAASAHTPVDLQTYSAWVQGKSDVPLERPSSALLSIARRPSIEIPVATATPVEPSAELPLTPPTEDGTDSASPFDVPAFLRRQKEA